MAAQENTKKNRKEDANDLRGTRVPAYEELIALDVKELRARAAIYKRLEVQRAVATLAELCAALQNSTEAEPEEEKAVHSAHALVKAWLDCIEDILLLIRHQEHDAGREVDLDQEWVHVNNIREAQERRVKDALRPLKLARKAREEEKRHSAASRELQRLLRPKILTTEYTMAEYREWKERFSTFYTSSRTADMPRYSQVQVLLSFLSRDLQVQLQSRTRGTDPPINGGGPGSCAAVLDDIFAALHPPFKNLRTFLTLKQEPHEDIETLLARVTTAASQADTDQVSLDDLIAHVFATAVSHPWVYEQISRLNKITIDEVEKVARQYKIGLANGYRPTPYSSSKTSFHTRLADAPEPEPHKAATADEEALVAAPACCELCGGQHFAAHCKQKCPACNRKGARHNERCTQTVEKKGNKKGERRHAYAKKGRAPAPPGARPAHARQVNHRSNGPEDPTSIGNLSTGTGGGPPVTRPL